MSLGQCDFSFWSSPPPNKVERPNIVMGANAQVALEKFARYFDVECRLVPISVESKYRLDPKKAMEYVDENTIGVFVILGSELLCCMPLTESANLRRHLYWSLRACERDIRSPR
jgi:hypothetical protein